MRDPIEHQIDLRLASGADLKILYFSDREMRWIFSYSYRGERRPGEQPDVVNQVRLTAEYIEGLLAPSFVLSMHVVIPSRLGQSYFAGVDISPGGKTYLEFTYRLYRESPDATAYRLAEIKGRVSAWSSTKSHLHWCVRSSFPSRSPIVSPPTARPSACRSAWTTARSHISIYPRGRCGEDARQKRAGTALSKGVALHQELHRER